MRARPSVVSARGRSAFQDGRGLSQGHSPPFGRPPRAQRGRGGAQRHSGRHVRGVVHADHEPRQTHRGGERRDERPGTTPSVPYATTAAADEVACELGKECRPAVRTSGSTWVGRARRTSRLTPMLIRCAPAVTAVPRNQRVRRSRSTTAPVSPAASQSAPCSPARDSPRAEVATRGSAPRARHTESSRRSRPRTPSTASTSSIRCHSSRRPPENSGNLERHPINHPFR